MPKSLDFTHIVSQLRNFHAKHHRIPTFAEMQKVLGYKSKGGVFKLMPHLLKRNILKKDSAGKFIQGALLKSSLRVLGTIQAGFPSPAEEELVDTMSLDEFLIKNPSATYILKVTGDSMIEEGIKEGDLVLVERGREPKSGDIVIAQVDSDWTMKFYQKINGKIVLVPANKKYSPIYPKDELIIGGVVVANVRKYK